jgi:hypothetical protein
VIKSRLQWAGHNRKHKTGCLWLKRATRNVDQGIREMTIVGDVQIVEMSQYSLRKLNILLLTKQTVTILNKQSRTATKRWSSSRGLGRWANNSSP